jgi:hypothetical protein
MTRMHKRLIRCAALLLGTSFMGCESVKLGPAVGKPVAPVPITNFSLQGRASEPIEYDRCSSVAHDEMADLLVKADVEDDGGVAVVREVVWDGLTVSGRVGLASWLSQCTQQGRPVAIVGDRLGRGLASYDPATGYDEVPIDR